ncbi:MAG: DNA polymerase III subunit delta [Nitrospiraceae bacterium]|nr:DNA polymerase III subunit delta [Nitrospiraceae bacterium]
MAMTKYDDLIRDLRKGTILPLYLFFGEEEFLIQEAVDLIIGQAVDPASRDFNFTSLHCKGTAASELVGLAQTLPFMADKRVIIAREVDAFKGADLEQLASYLADPSPSTCLVLIANQPRYDKKTVTSAVEKRGAVTRFYALLDREMPAWIERRAKTFGITLQRDAVQYLWQALGNDLQAISGELEKVAIAARDKKAVTFADVKAVVGDFREYATFDLADAVGKKNREKAFLILSRLLLEGEQPVGLLAAIAWNFRRLLKAKSMEAAGTGYEEIKRKLNIIFHQSASFQEQMRSYTLPELRKAFEVLMAADRSLKSGGLGGRLVLERMILALCWA